MATFWLMNPACLTPGMGRACSSNLFLVLIKFHLKTNKNLFSSRAALSITAQFRTEFCLPQGDPGSHSCLHGVLALPTPHSQVWRENSLEGKNFWKEKSADSFWRAGTQGYWKEASLQNISNKIRSVVMWDPFLWLLTAQNQLLSFVTAVPEVLFPPNLFMALPCPLAPSASTVWCHQLISPWVMEPANSSHSFSMPEVRWSLRIPWYLPDKPLQPPTFVISTGGGWYLY